MEADSSGRRNTCKPMKRNEIRLRWRKNRKPGKFPFPAQREALEGQVLGFPHSRRCCVDRLSPPDVFPAASIYGPIRRLQHRKFVEAQKVATIYPALLVRSCGSRALMEIRAG